jgi:hypothetical protein
MIAMDWSSHVPVGSRWKWNGEGETFTVIDRVGDLAIYKYRPDEHPLENSFARIYTGAVRQPGEGFESAYPDCGECDGIGIVECEYVDDADVIRSTRNCPRCQGTGAPT